MLKSLKSSIHRPGGSPAAIAPSVVIQMPDFGRKSSERRLPRLRRLLPTRERMVRAWRTVQSRLPRWRFRPTNRRVKLALIVGLLGAVIVSAGVGYWLGDSQQPVAASVRPSAEVRHVDPSREAEPEPAPRVVETASWENASGVEIAASTEEIPSLFRIRPANLTGTIVFLEGEEGP